MDTRDLYKLVRNLSEERDDIINLHDRVDLELNESFVIETGVVGFKDDGIILQLDEDAVEFLQFNGILKESTGSSEGVKNAVIRRIMNQHMDLLSKYGPGAVMAAVEDIASDLDDLEEIGSSDVSIWVKDVINGLNSGYYKDLQEGGYGRGGYTEVDDFKNKLSRSSDPFEMIYGAISGDYGDEIRDAMQEMYDDIVIDSQGRLHPDDDFEPIINTIIDQLVDDSGPEIDESSQIDELSQIKKLAHGDEEVAEGLGKALLGGAALIAAITGVNKMQADSLMKSEPQLVKLAQMRQQAEQKGDKYEVQSLDDRIQKTLDHIRVTGRPVMGPDGQPVVPGEPLGEAEYQGRDVPLNKPMQGDVKKSKVYVKKPDGNVVKVNFGDPDMTIKKSNPERRKSFRARHHCENPGPKWKARYWSCKAW